MRVDQLEMMVWEGHWEKKGQISPVFWELRLRIPARVVTASWLSTSPPERQEGSKAKNR